MGYTTEFTGQIKVEPALSAKEVEYINKFNNTRRMDRTKGQYYVDGGGFAGQDHESDVIDYNTPPAGQPGLWCNWEATPDGQFIQWDGGEKFYEADAWMHYIIEHFLGTDPIAKKELPFLEGHTLNGKIYAQGEDPDDRWILLVTDNSVTVLEQTDTGDLTALGL